MTVLIVGAGLAGVRVATSLRARGHSGAITLLGQESHLPYDRPPLTKRMLQEGADPSAFLELADYRAMDIDLRLGCRAERLDLTTRAVHLDTGEVVFAESVVIATGAHPRLLPDSDRIDGVHTLRTLDDLRAIRSALSSRTRVTIVGAGLIGCEAAASLRVAGFDVTVVESLPGPCIRVVGTELAVILAEIHRARGVKLRFGVGVTEIALKPDRHRVAALNLTDGSSVESDLVILGLGVSPTVAWLEQSGLELSDGVLCDDHGAASSPGIYAVGDAARWMNKASGKSHRAEHWTRATEQADIVAARILNQATPDSLPVPYWWSEQYDLKLQGLGATGNGQDVIICSVGPKNRPLGLYSLQGKLSGAVGFGVTRQLMKMRTLLDASTPIEEAVAVARA